MTEQRYTDGQPGSTLALEWQRLTFEGLLADVGAAVYWSVRRDWHADGCPGCVRQYILYRANYPIGGLIF